MRQGVRELCQRLLKQDGQPPYELGQDLFGTGRLAEPPSEAAKHQVWEALRAKHRCLG